MFGLTRIGAWQVRILPGAQQNGGLACVNAKDREARALYVPLPDVGRRGSATPTGLSLWLISTPAATLPALRQVGSFEAGAVQDGQECGSPPVLFSDLAEQVGERLFLSGATPQVTYLL